MNEANPYQTPESGGSGESQPRGSTRRREGFRFNYGRSDERNAHGKLRPRQLAVAATFALLLMMAAYYLVAGIVPFTRARPAPPAADGLADLMIPFDTLDEPSWREARGQGKLKLVLSVLLVALSAVPWTYWRQFRPASRDSLLLRSPLLQFRLLAALGFAMSCLSAVGTYYGFYLPLTYDVGQIIDTGLLFLGICGFVVSVIALAIGDTAAIEAKVARRYYVLAWIGLALPVIRYLSWLCYIVFHVRPLYVIYDLIRRLL